jgi:RNA polymerase sigma-70 factor (sigma-E family)
MTRHDGDEGAFNAFVKARSVALSRTAYLLTGDHHLAEDLLQTALLQAARHWSRIHTAPEAYVRRTLYTQNISWWRRRRRRSRARRLRRAGRCRRAGVATSGAGLATAHGEAATVLVLRYFEDLTEVQTAAELGVSVGTVKSTTRQALGRLRILAPELADLIGVN